MDVALQLVLRNRIVQLLRLLDVAEHRARVSAAGLTDPRLTLTLTRAAALLVTVLVAVTWPR
jgi:hypothetical protein